MSKRSSFKEYIEKARLRLRDTIYDLKESSEWKINLTMTPKFMVSIDSNEKCKKYSKSDNNTRKIGSDRGKIVK